MARTNQFQAVAFKTPTANGSRTLREASKYPEVPAFWPNRSVRRAVQKSQVDRIPKCWLDAFFKFPNLKQAVHGLAA